MITSPANARVKAAAALRNRSERERSGLFLIEGHREIDRAIQAGIIIEHLFILEGVEKPAWTVSGMAELVLGPVAFAKIAYGRDGVVAVARRPTFDLESFNPAAPQLVLVTESIEKPGNLGAMLRSAAATGAALLVADAATDMTNPNVVRASVGSLFSVPVAQTTSGQAKSWLHNHDIVVAAAVAHDGVPPWSLDLTRPIALVIGSEHTGLSSTWLETAVSRIQIPMAGAVDSLNAATAAAILLFEAIRQRSAGR
ncbi:MAG: TrmH family RNA methyltransferase [Acidimicrobiia bacterium]